MQFGFELTTGDLFTHGAETCAYCLGLQVLFGQMQMLYEPDECACAVELQFGVDERVDEFLVRKVAENTKVAVRIRINVLLIVKLDNELFALKQLHLGPIVEVHLDLIVQVTHPVVVAFKINS